MLSKVVMNDEPKAHARKAPSSLQLACVQGVGQALKPGREKLKLSTNESLAQNPVLKWLTHHVRKYKGRN